MSTLLLVKVSNQSNFLVQTKFCFWFAYVLGNSKNANSYCQEISWDQKRRKNESQKYIRLRTFIAVKAFTYCCDCSNELLSGILQTTRKRNIKRWLTYIVKIRSFVLIGGHHTDRVLDYSETKYTIIKSTKLESTPLSGKCHLWEKFIRG